MENLEEGRENNLLSVQRENFSLKEENVSLSTKIQDVQKEVLQLNQKNEKELERNQTLQKTIRRLESSIEELKNAPEKDEDPRILELTQKLEQERQKQVEDEQKITARFVELETTLNSQNLFIEGFKVQERGLLDEIEKLKEELKKDETEEGKERKKEDKQLKLVRKVFTHSYSLFAIQIIAMFVSSGFAYLEISKLGKSNAISVPLSVLFGISLSIISFNRVNILITIYFILYELTNGLLFFEAPFNSELQTAFKILQATFIPIFTLVIISVVNKKTKK